MQLIWASPRCSRRSICARTLRLRKIYSSEEKNLNIEIDDNKKKKNYPLYNTDNEEEEEENDEEEEDDILDKKSSLDEKDDDFLEKMLKKEKELEALRKQKEKDIETVLSNNEDLRKKKKKKNLNSDQYDTNITNLMTKYIYSNPDIESNLDTNYELTRTKIKFFNEKKKILF